MPHLQLMTNDELSLEWRVESGDYYKGWFVPHLQLMTNDELSLELRVASGEWCSLSLTMTNDE